MCRQLSVLLLITGFIFISFNKIYSQEANPFYMRAEIGLSKLQ